MGEVSAGVPVQSRRVPSARKTRESALFLIFFFAS